MNEGTETLFTVMPDYACRENDNITVIVTGFVKNGKVVNTIIKHGHISNK